MSQPPEPGHAPARWWHALANGRLQCDLCPRACSLQAGQRGACFVRAREADHMVLTHYGSSAGFCIDPIEKKPLYHFHPGSSVLSFGTVGCNLACKFCQNWDITRSRDQARLLWPASGDAIAAAAAQAHASSVAFTYNDPVIFAEYAIDTARACQARSIHPVAVTAGYINAAARAEFFAPIEAANVDLKGFTEAFYARYTGGHLAPVLDTLSWLCHESNTWLEITTLIIPGANDSDTEITALARWIARELSSTVPLHLSAFHPDYRLTDRPATTLESLRHARELALAQGLRHVYLGNVRDGPGNTTYCTQCGQALIVREGYAVLAYNLSERACCIRCGAQLAGRFGATADHFGNRRIPIRIDPHC